jgi:hypothetical protein
MPLSLDEIRACAADAIAPRHFFIGNGLELEWEHAETESIPWEIFKGRLLDASQTRERHTFEAWNVYSIDEFGRSTEPLLSLKLDADTKEIYVVRAILCYAWEAYDAGDNVIESRETTKWVRELVGTVDSAEVDFDWEFTIEIAAALFHAVVGTSRLPLTSLESPLPTFSLGKLAYFNGRSKAEQKTAPMVSWREVVACISSSGEAFLGDSGKALEFLLRFITKDEFGPMLAEFVAAVRTQGHQAVVDLKALGAGSADAEPVDFKAPTSDPLISVRGSIILLLWRVFNDAALTPYTDLADKVLSFVNALESQRHLLPCDIADFFGRILCQLGRHLTAYDLVTFHHRGANYPDALVLDELLKAYLRFIEREPGELLPAPSDDETTQRIKRLRRRGLRQAWLLRRRYEGHLVPDAPTSPGENLRVLPTPYSRVPEEQIFNPANRTKRLYLNDPLDRYLGSHAQGVLRQSIEDLRHPKELREVGMASFLDRPLSADKGPAEPDETLLFSYLAFSRSIACERLGNLVSQFQLIESCKTVGELREMSGRLEVPGLSIKESVDCSRPAIVSLADAMRTAEDFVLLRTASRPWSQFGFAYFWRATLSSFAFQGLHTWNPELLVRAPKSSDGLPHLIMYDGKIRPRVELAFDPRQGYISRKGIEFPASPLRILRVWEQDGDGKHLRERDLSGEMVLLEPPIL